MYFTHMINLLYFNISAKGLFQEKTCTLVSTILLPRPLRHDPRFIQCIYRYSHASKRLVEVYIVSVPPF